MKDKDDNIRKALESKLTKLNDESFTEDIIKFHLISRKTKTKKPFFSFMSLIVGLSAVIMSIGFVILLKLNNQFLGEIGFTERHGIITFSLSLIYIVYKLIDDFTAPNIRYSKFVMS